MTKNKKACFLIGVNPLVTRRGKLLLGRRKHVFDSDTWGLPGGHLEGEESVEEGAARELLEETNLRCKNFVIDNIVNTPSSDNILRLQIGLEAKKIKGEVKNMEPDKCYELKWFPFNKLPKNISKNHQEQIKIFLKNKKLK